LTTTIARLSKNFIVRLSGQRIATRYTIREAESKITGCEQCRSEDAEIPFDWILADVLGKAGLFEFILAETARCPGCGAELSEKTLVEPQGGIDAAAPAF
jgi:hypothetical protein